MFVGKRSQPDLQTSISFLCTRVLSPDISDRKKLKRLLQFIHATLDDKLILSMDGLTVMTTWVDTSYAVHNDMKGHTGGCIILGGGMIYCRSSKKKVNTKIYTESEVFGASNYLPFTICIRFFLEAQGFKI